jgi:hypothetical protein
MLSPFQVNVNGREFRVPEWDLTKSVIQLEIDGEIYILQIHGRGNGPVWKIGFQGATYDFKLLSTYTHSLLSLMPLPKSVRQKKLVPLSLIFLRKSSLVLPKAYE